MFHRGCAISRSHQQRGEAPTSPHPCQPSLVSFSITASLVGVTRILFERDSISLNLGSSSIPPRKGSVHPISTMNFPCTHTLVHTSTHSPGPHQP